MKARKTSKRFFKRQISRKRTKELSKFEGELGGWPAVSIAWTLYCALYYTSPQRKRICSTNISWNFSLQVLLSWALAKPQWNETQKEDVLMGARRARRAGNYTKGFGNPGRAGPGRDPT